MSPGFRGGSGCVLWRLLNCCACLSFAASSLSRSWARSGHFGVSDASEQGTVVLSWRPNRSCAGAYPLLRGVARYAWRASARLPGAAISLLAVWTARSAAPLLWAWYGELVRWAKSHCSANLANSSLANCGPLSLTNSSGLPCVAKRWLDDVLRCGRGHGFNFQVPWEVVYHHQVLCVSHLA